MNACGINHVSHDDLELYVLHRASAQVVEIVEEHLLVCEQCRCALDELEQELRVLRIYLRETEINSPVV